MELGLDASFWMSMKSDGCKIIDINRAVLWKWRDEHPGISKFEELAQALTNVGISITAIFPDLCER